MNKIEHYKQAELYLQATRKLESHDVIMETIAKAQVHATLAASTIGMLDETYIGVRLNNEDKLNL